jgi:hypothetical protein
MMKNLLLIFFLIHFSPSIFAQQPDSSSTILATVNGEPICAGEYNLVSPRFKAQVIQEYRSKFNLNYDDQFWNNTTYGISPATALKKKVLAALIEIKLQQIQAKKLGIIEDISYSGFLKSLTRENESRKKAIQNQKVIFGPTQYTDQVYYDYLFSNMVIKLKLALSKNGLQISDSTLKSIYEKQKDSLFKWNDFVRIRTFKVVPMNQESLDKKQKYAILNKLRNEILKQNNKNLNFKTTNNKWKIVENELKFDKNLYLSEADDENQSLYQHIKDKIEGDVSEIIENSGNLLFFSVLEKKTMGYKSFDSCKNTIQSSYLDLLYSNYFKVLTNKAIIVLN